MKYIVLEKGKRVSVKPYTREGKFVVGYSRLDPREAELEEEKKKKLAELEEKLKWAHRKTHHDVGEKIGGAKKDKWAEITAANIAEVEAEGAKVAYSKVTKDAVFQKLNMDVEKAMDVSPGAAYMKQQLLASIASRPPDSPEMRAAYANAAEFVQGSLMNCLTVNDVVNFITEFDQLRAMRKQVRTISEEEFKKLSTVEYERTPGHYFHDEGKALKALGYSNSARAEKILGTEEYAIYDMTEDTTFTKYLASLGDRMTVIVTDSARGHGFYSYGRKTSVFWKRDWAMARKLEKENDWAWAGEKTKEAGERKKKFEWERKVSSEINRVGGEAPPRGTKANHLMRDFDVRGIEYGNWISDDDAKYHIQHSWEALSDLADILGLDKVDVSLNKRLALAIGARGSGKARAHYEPIKKVINLTKFSGGGCVAHEWGHALDNILAEIAMGGEKGKTYFLSGGIKEGDVTLISAFSNVMSAIKKGDPSDPWRLETIAKMRTSIEEQRKAYYALPMDYKNPEMMRKKEEARKALNEDIKRLHHFSRENQTSYYATAKMLGTYWERPHELFARAFESYVEDKLHEKGRDSTYLVSGTNVKYDIKLEEATRALGLGSSTEPYPQGKEREVINRAMENLMSIIRSNASLKKALLDLFTKYVIIEKSKGGFVRPRANAMGEEEKESVKKQRDEEGTETEHLKRFKERSKERREENKPPEF